MRILRKQYLTDNNTLYFIQDKALNQGITFYNVLDGNDGKAYYIPEGDEISLTTLDDITANITSSN